MISVSSRVETPETVLRCRDKIITTRTSEIEINYIFGTVIDKILDYESR